MDAVNFIMIFVATVLTIVVYSLQLRRSVSVWWHKRKLRKEKAKLK